MADVAEKLRLVHVVGAGTDRVDFTALPDDVLVANTFHHERSIAEYVLAAAIMLTRDFLGQDRALRGGVWATSVYDDTISQPRITGAVRVGFLGFGHIGQLAWELLRGIGCSRRRGDRFGSCRRRRARPVLGGRHLAARDDLLRDSDVVVVSAPLTEQTRGMIGAAELRALGPDGVLVNVGRGPLVDERALYEALRDRVIRGGRHRRLVSLSRPGAAKPPHLATCRSTSCRTS